MTIKSQQRNSATAQQRNSATAQQRNSATAQQRNSATAQQRTFARSALAAALIAAGLLSVSPDGFAADVTTDQQYRDALYGTDTTITVKQSLTLTPRQFFGTWGSNWLEIRPSFILEGEYSGSGAPSVVISSNRSALGHALSTRSAISALAPGISTIRNLTFRDFSVTWGNEGGRSSVLDGGYFANGLRNVHFIDNYADLWGAVNIRSLNGGMHDVHVLNNRSLVGPIFQVYTLSGGIHRARFVGNSSANEMLAVEGMFYGGLNDSVFIGNEAKLPADFPAYPHFTDVATASVVVLENDVALNNNVFLANSSNQTNAQNPVGAARGAAIVQNTDNASGTSNVAISAGSGKRTLFYGNTHNAGSGPAPSGIHFESAFDYDVGDMPSYAGNPMTVNVAMNADSNGNILMLDPISAQPDGLTDLHISNPATITYGGITYDVGDEPYDVKYSNLTVNVDKTGSGTWFLGGKSELPGASNWNINQGTLTLATVNYGGTLGVIPAAVNLSNATTASFTLGSSATLAGSGTIAAKTIALNGTVRPGMWVNTGTLASDISNTISDADIAAIDVAQSSPWGTLTFTGDVTMTGAKVYANIGNVADTPTDKNLLDVSGSLTLNGNANELIIRPRSDTLSNVAVISAAGGITGDFDPANVFVTTPDFFNMTAVANKVGNNIEVSSTGVSLTWNETDPSPANGTFNLDDAIPVFSVNTALTGANKPLIKEGAGTLFLNGENTYTGPTTVADGTLRVGETAGSTAKLDSKVEVAAGATIGGHGTLLGGLVLNAGAMVSPGASIGTLTAHGDVGAPGTIYEMEINADGTADQFIVENGQIALTDSTLKVVRGAGSGPFGLSTTYTGIIQASGGVVGEFATIDNTLPLMQADVSYNPNSVDLTMTRNDTAFATLGASANQVRVGQALDALAASHPVADAVSQLTADGIRGAMDNLSGEIYASARSAWLGNRHLQSAVKQRMQNVENSPPQNTPLWANTWGYSGHLSGNANAAKVDQRGLGLALGGDWQIGNTLRAGAVLAYEDGRVKTNGTDAARRNARSDVDAYSAGAYLAGSVGSVEVRTGLTYSWLDLETRRDITVPGLQGQAKAKYKGSKTQVFAEISKAFTLNSLTLAPYAGLSQSWLHTQSAREAGSAAALDIASQTDHVTQSTLGLRLAYSLPGSAVALTLDAAWARAFGDTDTQTRQRFSNAGERFTVQGVEVGKNTALIGAGVQAQLSPNAALGVGYQGQFGSNTRHHAGHVQVRVRF